MSKDIPDLSPNQPGFDTEEEIILNNEKNNNKKKKVLKNLSYILAVAFFITSLFFIFTRFWEGVLFLITGVIVLPDVHNRIEQSHRFKFKILPKTILCVIIISFALILGNNYEKKENEKAKLERIEKEKEQLAKEEAERKEKVRIDSLSFYQNSAIQLLAENKLKEAYNSIQATLRLSETEKEKTLSNSINADYLFKSKKYTEAVVEFTKLINKSFNLSDTYYKRAVCYQKTNKIQEAVNDLKEAIKLGNEDAKQLHEKINPLKKRVVGYVTLCCDGTTSSAKGRGACSHHGGVCDWNHPIYEEYRQY